MDSGDAKLQRLELTNYSLKQQQVPLPLVTIKHDVYIVADAQTCVFTVAIMWTVFVGS